MRKLRKQEVTHQSEAGGQLKPDKSGAHAGNVGEWRKTLSAAPSWQRWGAVRPTGAGRHHDVELKALKSTHLNGKD